jgi:hypothetical protein
MFEALGPVVLDGPADCADVRDIAAKRSSDSNTCMKLRKVTCSGRETDWTLAVAALVGKDR